MSDLAPIELTADEARELTAEIRRDLDGLLPKVKRAFEGRADRALGYASWQAYCAAELGDVRVPLGDRPTAVAELRGAGMSTRAIGSALGIGQTQVMRDLERLNTKGSDGQPERIVSLDGRARPAARPAAEERADPAPAIAAEVLRVLAEVGPNGASVAQISDRGSDWPLGIVIAQIEAAVRELANGGQVEPAGRGMNGNRVVDLWALAEQPPEDLPVPAPGEGRSAGLPSPDAPGDASDASVVGAVAADKLPAGRACEACGGGVPFASAASGYRRCGDCDPAGEHWADGDGGLCLGCNPPTDEPAPEPEPARPPLLSPEEVQRIQAEAERGRAIAHARRVAERLQTEVSGFITDIEAAVLYGETGLFTEDMAAFLRKQADRVEHYLGERQ